MNLVEIYYRILSPVSLTIKCTNCISAGARGVMVIVVGNEHGDTSSNPGRD